MKYIMKYYEISTLFKCAEKNLLLFIIGCKIIGWK